MVSKEKSRTTENSFSEKVQRKRLVWSHRASFSFYGTPEKHSSCFHKIFSILREMKGVNSGRIYRSSVRQGMPLQLVTFTRTTTLNHSLWRTCEKKGIHPNTNPLRLVGVGANFLFWSERRNVLEFYLSNLSSNSVHRKKTLQKRAIGKGYDQK